MGIAERKERERREMRNLILETATAMFLEDGFEKTSLRAIAERIQYSPATIYLYFKDKDELFCEIQHRGFALFLEVFKSLANQPKPLERLRALADAYMRFALENPGYYDLMFIMRAPMKAFHNSPDPWNEGKASYEYLKATIQACAEAGYRLRIDLESAALMAWSTCHGVVALRVRDRLKGIPDEDLNYMISRIMDQLAVSLFENALD
ncbi:MAG: TetR/AcrR family transcriptional regulator [Bacteroidota bacterium]